MSKNLVITIGRAAALLSSAGIAEAQVAPVRQDSTVIRRVVIQPGRVDSILILATRIAQEPYGSPAWVKFTAALDTLFVRGLPGGFIRGPMPVLKRRLFPMAKGWLGINTQGPAAPVVDSTGARLVRFFGYQDIISVDPGSPAERAGIAPGDVLVAYNGVDLINHDFNLADIVVPKKRVDLTVRRDGAVKEYSLTAASVPDDVARRRVDLDNKVFGITVPASGAIFFRASGDSESPLRVPPRGRGRGVVAVGGFGEGTLLPSTKMIFLPNGLFGASLSNISEELARLIKLQKGILVNDVPEDTPAFRAGLRVGDVIVTCDDDSVSTVGELRDVVARRLANHSVALQIVRQQRVKKLTVSWPDSP